MKKPGYLYVLVHPSDPTMIKVGHTTVRLEERIAKHNSDLKERTGQIANETGQKWELKEYIDVPDPAFAKAVFWETSSVHALRGNEDITSMRWDEVQLCLDVAKKAGIRPPLKPRTTPVRDREWMIKQLEGSGITMIGSYRGLVSGVEFQCEKGHVFKESAGVVAHRKTCLLCKKET
jgi:hypothetical protein